MQNKEEVIESQKKEIKKLKQKLRYNEKVTESIVAERDSIAKSLSIMSVKLENYIRLESSKHKRLMDAIKQLELIKATIKDQRVVIESQELKIEEMKRNVNVRRGEVIRRELNYYQQDLGRVKSKLLQSKNEVEKLKIKNSKLMGYLELAVKCIAGFMGKSSKYEQETHWNNFKNKNLINL